MTGLLAQLVLFGAPVLLAGARCHARFLRWVRREERAHREWQAEQDPAWAELLHQVEVDTYGRHALALGADRVPVGRLLARHPLPLGGGERPPPAGPDTRPRQR